MDAVCDMTVAVISPAERRLARIMERDGLTEAQALLPDGRPAAGDLLYFPAAVVLQNDGDLKLLQKRADALAARLRGVGEWPISVGTGGNIPPHGGLCTGTKRFRRWETARRAAERRVELAALFVLLRRGAAPRGIPAVHAGGVPCSRTATMWKNTRKFYEFEPSLIYALIRTESEFDPDAISSAHAMGLMQLTADTFQWGRAAAGDGKPPGGRIVRSGNQYPVRW